MKRVVMTSEPAMQNPVNETVSLNKATMKSLWNISEQMSQKSQLHFILGMQYLRFGKTALAKQHLERARKSFRPAASCQGEWRKLHETKLNLGYAQSLYDFADSSRVTVPGTGKGKRPSSNRRPSSRAGSAVGSDAGSSTDTDGEMTMGPIDIDDKMDVESHSRQPQQQQHSQLQAPKDSAVVTKAIEEAKKLLLDLVKKNNTRADCWNNLGRLLYDPRKPAIARMVYELLVNTFQGSDDLNNNLGVLRVVSGNPNKAKKLFRHVLTLCDTHLEALNNYAVLVLIDKKYKEATQILCKGLQQNMSEPQMWNAVAISYLMQHNQSYARGCIKEARNNEPYHTGAQWSIRFTMANYLLRVSRTSSTRDERLKCLEGAENLLEAVRQHEETSDVYVALAKVYQAKLETSFQKGMHLKESDKKKRYSIEDKVEKYIIKAIEMDQGNKHAWDEMGALYLRRREFDKAISVLSEAVFRDNNNPSMWMNLGLAYQLAGKLEAAERILEHVLQLDPFCFEAHTNLGNLYRSQGKLTKAKEKYEACIDLLKEACKLYENDPASLNRRSKKEAISLIAQAQNNLALIYIQEGDYVRAKEALSSAQGAAPQMAYIRKNFARLENIMRNQQKSIERKTE
mmetsp:Transcript_1836/g.4227  ORF Transcript_1836/g.4227 Transcript_1836/m.4227 type:complete len:627 (+) Transcript_1836:249-2129(+)